MKKAIAWAAAAAMALCLITVLCDQRRLHASRETHLKACIGNIRMLDAAKAQWAQENGIPDGVPAVTNGVLQFVKGNCMPYCPSAGCPAYSLGETGSEELPSCGVHGEWDRLHLADSAWHALVIAYWISLALLIVTGFTVHQFVISSTLIERGHSLATGLFSGTCYGELAAYKKICLAEGKSLIWWRLSVALNILLLLGFLGGAIFLRMNAGD